MNGQELSQRKLALELMHTILDLPSYAEAWNILGAEFEAVGMTANAESCWRRFRHYRDLDLEGYAQLVRAVTAVTAEVV